MTSIFKFSVKQLTSKLFILLALVFLHQSPPVNAAELIMLEQEHCPWCEAWEEEIGGIYHKTTEGKIAPLRRVDIHEDLPEDLKSMTRGNYTPTFVLWDNGKEIARLRGYPGDEFFWFLLGQMLEKLPDSPKEPTG